MASRRGKLLTAPALPPNATPIPSARYLLFHSWPGRIFLASAAIKIVVGLLRAVDVLPGVARVLSVAATVGLVISLSYFLWRLIVLTKRRLLWRVRRKLILSYIFFGVVPALLIVGFFILGGAVISMTVSAYLFRDGYDDLVENVRLVARTAADDIGRAPESSAQVIRSVHQRLQRRYPPVSVMFLPAKGRKEQVATAGAWRHTPPPDSIAFWVRQDGFQGPIAIPP